MGLFGVLGMLSAFGVATALIVKKKLTNFWIPTSLSALSLAEARMLDCVKSPLKHRLIPAGSHLIHTVSIENKSSVYAPLVLVHGYGGGLGLWANNFDSLSRVFSVHAFDLLGFGRSSRPPFSSKSPIEGLRFFLDPIEEWRQTMGIRKMNLVGHSLGAYVSAHYALQYPEHVENLVLVAPFGLDRRIQHLSERPLQWYITRAFLEVASPQDVLRATGPLGPVLLEQYRGADDRVRYAYQDGRVASYVYHLNASAGSGEYAFMSLQDGFGVVKMPLLPELSRLRVPFSLIYGEKDFIPTSIATEVMRTVPNPSHLFMVPNEGHHCYALHPELFLAQLQKAVDHVA